MRNLLRGSETPEEQLKANRRPMNKGTSIRVLPKREQHGVIFVANCATTEPNVSKLREDFKSTTECPKQGQRAQMRNVGTNKFFGMPQWKQKSRQTNEVQNSPPTIHQEKIPDSGKIKKP